MSKTAIKQVVKKVAGSGTKKTKPKLNVKKDKLDPTPSSPRRAIVQAQQYKKQQSGLEAEFDRTLKIYEGLKDKKSERAQLMVRKLNDMAKKIKGKKQIPMLPEGKAQGGMGLKMPTANQVGLKKLPTKVRNQMGYMYGGGMGKKPRMSKMDYRKGGMVIIALDLKKKGKK